MLLLKKFQKFKPPKNEFKILNLWTKSLIFWKKKFEQESDVGLFESERL